SLAGALRPRPGPTAVKGESPDTAVARRLARRSFRELRQVPLITGCPKTNRAGLAKSRPRAISARHTPRTGGGKRDGAPQARIISGAGEALPLVSSPHPPLFDM